MRIAYLVNQYPATSHSFIRREILALEQLGFEVVRVSIREPANKLVDIHDQSEQARTFYVLRQGVLSLLLAVAHEFFTRPISFARALTFAWRMGRRADRPRAVHLIYFAEACSIKVWLRQKAVEHLHAHFGTNSAEVAMLVHLMCGPTWSFTVHGPEEFDKPTFIGLIEKINNCSFVVGISSYTRSQLYRWTEFQHWSKVHVIRCGLEESFFDKPAPPVRDARRFVCVGRLCEQKGQLLLIEAARRLFIEGVHFELVLAGDGADRGVIENYIISNNMHDRVSITGWISNEQVRVQILAARALVLPSFAEGLPVVIMEAMALRRPVISTFVAGIPELVQTGKHGWLIPPGDVVGLMNALRTCLDTPIEALIGMGEAARERVLCHHRIDKEASRLAKLFETSTRAK